MSVRHSYSATASTRVASVMNAEAEGRMFFNTHTRLIEWGDCDPAGIVFFPRYLAYFDTCTALLFAKAGFDKHALRRQFAIVGFPMVDLRTQFHIPSHYGEEVKITSSIGEFRRSSFDVRHELYKGEALAVESTETRVWTGVDSDNPERLKSKPIPDEVKKALAPMQ